MAIPSDHKARWAVIISLLLLSLPLLIACATAPSSRTYIDQNQASTISTGSEESFQELWAQWTVQIGSQAKGGFLGFLSKPITGGGGKGPGGRGNEFPLYVDATLMDSVLIETGLRYFAERIEMSLEEEETFRQKYFDHYKPTDYLLIWCELRTHWAENYLNFDRWIIYIEDDAGNRFEPEKIIEERQSYRRMVMDKPLAFQVEQNRPGRDIHYRTVMLCFPKCDFYGNPIQSERVQFLKLIFQQIDDRNVKGEGEWVFKR